MLKMFRMLSPYVTVPLAPVMIYLMTRVMNVYCSRKVTDIGSVGIQILKLCSLVTYALMHPSHPYLQNPYRTSVLRSGSPRTVPVPYFGTVLIPRLHITPSAETSSSMFLCYIVFPKTYMLIPFCYLICYTYRFKKNFKK